MAKKSWIIKQKSDPKYKTRKYLRCRICGRARGVYKRFGICRICFRQLSLQGQIPGVRKASW